MLPPESDSVCPSSITVQKEDCKEAGLAVGGMLQGGEIVEGSWTDRPSGCFFGPDIHFNTNPNGINNGQWHSICHKMEVRYQFHFNLFSQNQLFLNFDFIRAHRE